MNLWGAFKAYTVDFAVIAFFGAACPIILNLEGTVRNAKVELLCSAISVWIAFRPIPRLYSLVSDEERLAEIALTSYSPISFLKTGLSHALTFSGITWGVWIMNTGHDFDPYPADRTYVVMHLMIGQAAMILAASSDVAAHIATKKSKARPFVRMAIWIPVLFTWLPLLEELYPTALYTFTLYALLVAAVIVTSGRLPIVWRKIFDFN